MPIEPETVASASLTEPPLLSFCLFSYNQERFVRESVAGAFSQTYSPLQIVLSDDGSTDRTFEIIKEMAAAYRGPHTIVLNRNPKNLGIGGHVNRVMEIAQGALIVVAAADDISYPNRTSAIYEEWLQHGRTPTTLYSDYEVMDEHGNLLLEHDTRHSFTGSRSEGIKDLLTYVRGTHPASHFAGPTHAWSPRLFEKLGPLNQDVVFEDKVIGFRSLLCGSFARVPKKLIRYRRHSSNLCGYPPNLSSRIGRARKVIEKEKLFHVWQAAMLNNYQADVHTLAHQGNLQTEEAMIVHEIDHSLKVTHCKARIYSASPITALAWFVRRLILRPQRREGWSILKHWGFRSLDHFGLLPRE